MSSQNYLYRGGEKIAIEKEPEFFTAIVPNPQIVEQLQQMEPVQEVRQVFSNIYKVRTAVDNRDDLMQQMRTDDKTPGIYHHAYHPVGDEATRYYITDLLIVAFQPQVSDSRIEEMLETHGLKFIKKLGDEQHPSYLLQVTKSAGKNPVKVSEDLQEQPEILFAEPNLVNRFQTFYTPQDPFFRYQWHLSSSRGIELSPDAHVDAAGAWDMTKGSRKIVVAVIDDGFDLTHPDLSGAGKVVYPKDYVDADNEPFPDTRHGDFHGTPCAGLAIGEENGTGVVGVAPGCAFLPIRFGLTADDNLLYQIFDYAGKRADVISNSWGPVPVYAPLSSLHRNQLAQLARTGGPRGKGCLIVFAAGNYNAPVYATDVQNFVWRHPTVGLKTTSGVILNGHAAHPDVVAVSASTSLNKKAAYSNWGKEIAVSAPSDNLHPLDFQIRVPGRSVWTTDNLSLGNRYTDKFGGTSASCPMVAGAAALVLSINPNLTAMEVRAILEATADKIIDTDPDPVLQLRKGTYNENGHSDWFGYGKVNAFNAVRKALESSQNEPNGTQQPEAPVVLKEGIHIVAAMVNPEGSDRGKEMVALFNATDQAVNLLGWELRNKRNESERIGELLLNPGATSTVFLSQLQLPNLGGKIVLLNPEGTEVDNVSYSLLEGLKKGWWIKF